MPIVALGKLSAGVPFSVRLDPKDHTKFVVDWSIGPVTPVDDTTAADDVAQRIGRIDDLLAAGAITEAEYARQRARILGEL